MTAEMVEFYQPEITLPRAQPCRECGTMGGYVKPGRLRPMRSCGYCNDCYGHLARHGQLPDDRASSSIYASEAEMLWHDPQLRRQPHALRSYAYDPHSVATAAEQRAARWLLDHPEQVQAGLTEATPLFGWGAA